jgi:hypothetical protein
MITIYHLIVKQPQLFFPVRSLFVPHIANSLNKLGVTATAGLDLRLLSVEILQVIFQWEEQATQARRAQDTGEIPKDDSTWLTPLNFRENMVSYLVRLTTGTSDQPSRNTLLPKAFSLLQRIVGPSGWIDVTVGLRFFLRALEQVSYILAPTLPDSSVHRTTFQVTIQTISPLLSQQPKCCKSSLLSSLTRGTWQMAPFYKNLSVKASCRMITVCTKHCNRYLIS